MNCMNCGAFLADKDLDYCPHCGCNVLIQKKVEYLSKLYYNQGLEKASIRDLSGAVNCLKQSLTFWVLCILKWERWSLLLASG